MTPGKPLVSAIVVSYNTRDLLYDCLRAFHACSDVPAEAVVVDNASTDGSPEMVAHEFPEAKLIRQPANVGFGRANNAGLQQAGPRPAGTVSPRLRIPSFPQSERLNRYTMGHLPTTETHEIDSGTAACLMVRRAAVDRVGFFDPDYFMYGEDLDLCYRLKSGGWKVFYLPTARAVHLKGQATRQETAKMLLEFHRAMWTFHHKHYAADLPAFANGLVWAGIWGRWALKAAQSAASSDQRVSSASG